MLLTLGHTPYKQWQVYRLKHLLIGTSRADAPTYTLGKTIAGVLAEGLPESRARVARARGVYRLGSLISTNQLKLLILSREHATALAAGRGPFEDFGPTPIHVLFEFGAHFLVSRADFPARHAWAVTTTLLTHGDAVQGNAIPSASTAPVPIHPGTLAAIAGKPIDELPEVALDGVGDN